MKNTPKQTYSISIKERQLLNGHKAILLWFTGLSGSGKSTIANAVEKALFEKNIHTYTLDGDNVRNGLNKNLSFSEEDRTENIRRIAEVATLFLDAGVVVLAAFISPFTKDRELIKQIVKDENVVEIFVDTPLEICEKRDVKGLYAKAMAGQIKDFTGISAPYESPIHPDIHINTTETNVEKAVEIILKTVVPKIKLQ